MAKQGKKRVSITVDAERFDRVSSILDEKGYPRGYLSFYLDRCIEDLEDYFTGEPQPLSALQDLKLDEFLKREKQGKK